MPMLFSVLPAREWPEYICRFCIEEVITRYMSALDDGIGGWNGEADGRGGIRREKEGEVGGGGDGDGIMRSWGTGIVS